MIAGRIEHTAAGKPAVTQEARSVLQTRISASAKVGVGYYPSFARLRAGATSCEKAAPSPTVALCETSS